MLEDCEKCGAYKTEAYVEKCLRINQANEHSRIIAELEGEIARLRFEKREISKWRAIDIWRKIFPWRLVRWNEWENR